MSSSCTNISMISLLRLFSKGLISSERFWIFLKDQMDLSLPIWPSKHYSVLLDGFRIYTSSLDTILIWFKAKEKQSSISTLAPNKFYGSVEIHF